MEDFTQLDLKRDLDRQSEKLDHLILEIHQMKVELLAATAVHSTKIEQHDRDLGHAFDDIHKLEDRSWRTGGAVLLAAISFIGTAALAILTFVL